MLLKKGVVTFKALVAIASLVLIVISIRPELASAAEEEEWTCTAAAGWCCDCWMTPGRSYICAKMQHGTGVETCSANPWNCPTDPTNWCERP